MISAETDWELPAPVLLALTFQMTCESGLTVTVKALEAASVILQRDGHRRRCPGRIEIGQHEVLLETTPGVAFGKEPVVGQLLHSNHIGTPRDDAGIAAIDTAEVGGTLAHHGLAGGEHHRDTGR